MSNPQKDQAVEIIQEWLDDHDDKESPIMIMGNKIFIYSSKGKVEMPKALVNVYKSLYETTDTRGSA